MISIYMWPFEVHIRIAFFILLQKETYREQVVKAFHTLECPPKMSRNRISALI
jgi:hypothetical protein